MSRQENQTKLIDTDHSMAVTRRQDGGVVKGKKGQIYGDRRFDFRW